ncbi:type II toxin-antitoxin system HicA family toxin [Bosea sp. (in: a-proteobacteria)]|uniref:type II toxin-antitoxin system HicA family toxin n=1 Tax=Bosea sp. (in: a-proteobacteria) TaxID=1871050 RepID=UPI0026294337|nr:type II toxin-antitoxin system HicA family toxin [Bosea sp. (in: a-proteobacteria)]MCO5091924.1 type II toxin-antitoxin system HicA family toxin [Bosea sp. (in: a-proteobacteria)]
MLNNSAEIIRRLEREGWKCVRVAGSHHVFKKPGIRDTIVVPHPKKNFGPGLVLKIYKQAGWSRD